MNVTEKNDMEYILLYANTANSLIRVETTGRWKVEHREYSDLLFIEIEYEEEYRVWFKKGKRKIVKWVSEYGLSLRGIPYCSEVFTCNSGE